MVTHNLPGASDVIPVATADEIRATPRSHAAQMCGGTYADSSLRVPQQDLLQNNGRQ